MPHKFRVMIEGKIYTIIKQSRLKYVASEYASLARENKLFESVRLIETPESLKQHGKWAVAVRGTL